MASSLTAEESLLLLTCRPHLTNDERATLRRVVVGVRDWPYILWRTEQYRILPLLFHHLQEAGLLAGIPKMIAVYLESWTALSEARSVEQFRQLGRIIRGLEEERIEYFLLKGCGLATLYYPSPLLRPMQDLDLIVRPEDAIRTQQLMFALGFEHGIWDSDSETFAATEVDLTEQSLNASIELPPFTYFVRRRSPLPRKAVPDEWRRQHIKCAIDKDGELVVPVFVDVHTNLSDGLDLEDVWRGARWATILDVPVRVQTATGMLWFIAARLYFEAFTYNTLKLSMFGDVHTLLTQATGEIDWPEVLAIAYKYGLRPALYYVLAQARALMNAPVPLKVLSILRPDPQEIPLENDWGDFMPKLLSQPLLHKFSYFAQDDSRR